MKDKSKYKSVYHVRKNGGRVSPYIRAMFKFNGGLVQKCFAADEERKAALWVDTKRIELGLEPINILKKLEK